MTEMKHLLNTLYIRSKDSYLALDGGNVAVKNGDHVIAKYVLIQLQDIVSFSYMGASPALMGYCAEHNIGISFCKPNGKFLARVSGMPIGNILLRREQYRVADAPQEYVLISRNMILGKIHNQKYVVDRMRRNHGMRFDCDMLEHVSEQLSGYMRDTKTCMDPEVLRGIEGLAAKAYFGVFGDFVLNDRDVFCFEDRNRRPPLDPVNAMLSFGYAMLANECASALVSFGLDPYAGFLHRDRPGRKSLALDLMEEFRPIMVDRFVLTVINNRQLDGKDFDHMDGGAVMLNDEGRRKFLKLWHDGKEETVRHPYLDEKVEWGMLPFVQAQLLARYLRGDMDGYPPVLWR